MQKLIIWKSQMKKNLWNNTKKKKKHRCFSAKKKTYLYNECRKNNNYSLKSFPQRFEQIKCSSGSTQ